MHSRALLVLLTLWALAMIAPDFARVVRPLSSFGFYANSDGLIYDVTGPFETEQASPAWRAGLLPGEQLDLKRMRCWPYESERCGSVLAALGGVQFVTPGRSISIALESKPNEAPRELTLTAEIRPSNWFTRGVLLLDQIAGIAVILAAAWLVWMRPGPMSWGFFLYVMWFNPGQSFEFYAQLQRWPPALLAQNFLGCLAQAAGYAGLLLFVVRAPSDTEDPRWRGFERALPAVALAIAAALIASYGSVFGFKTETLTRATILFGLVVSVTAVAILLARRSGLSPKDRQRLRWVMWGCLIGLPAFVAADLFEYTTLLNSYGGGVTLPDDIAGLLYLINGVLCMFVFEAVRRQRVVSVSIPLRRVTLLALLTSVPAMLLHHQAEHFQEAFELPNWALFLIGALVVFVIGRLHHGAVEVADQFFNRQLDKLEKRLCEAVLAARSAENIDALLSDGVADELSLSSAATFRQTEEDFRRHGVSRGWDARALRNLGLVEATLAPLLRGEACVIGEKEANTANFPLGLDGPLLAVPAANSARCFAVTLYGPHIDGTAIDASERTALESLGAHAADAYALLENEELRLEVARLRVAGTTK